jgi:HrpA-like RNA helicase
MNDDFISKCTHLVLDEIHERDINTDILLLAVRRLLGINKNLKVLIMSATLDAEKFHKYFSESESGLLDVGKPIKIETSTNFPVASYHLEDVVGILKQNKCFPTHMSSMTRQFIQKELEGDEALPETVPVELISGMTKYLHENKDFGSILCFLPGWEDIVAAKNEIEQILSTSSKRFRIYCIHSSAPPEVTQSIFQKSEGERKIILATNIAESSITIPDVAYVVDAGKQKINMYNPALRMNSLKTTWISKSNSIQRLGRVGRTQPGEYYLMCSRTRSLSPSLPPEILRVGLEDVCLSVKGLGFEGKCSAIFEELLDKPNKIALRDAVNRLISLDALEAESENITELGRILSTIPLNPSKNVGCYIFNFNIHIFRSRKGFGSFSYFGMFKGTVDYCSRGRRKDS